MALVEITPQEYDVEIDIVYATDRNFTGAPIYTRSACYLHADAAKCLKKASAMARPIPEAPPVISTRCGSVIGGPPLVEIRGVGEPESRYHRATRKLPLRQHLREGMGTLPTPLGVCRRATPNRPRSIPPP